MKKEELINWRAVSRILSGNDTSIRSNKVPQKYEQQVQEFISLIDIWCEKYIDNKSLEGFTPVELIRHIFLTEKKMIVCEGECVKGIKKRKK